MPELPDLTVYQDALALRLVGQSLTAIRLRSPFVLRSVAPAADELVARQVRAISRMAKQLVIELEGERFIVMHLMISGRLHWKARGARIAGKMDLAAFDFPDGTLTFTEASQKKRASLHFVAGRAALAAFDPGGLDVLTMDAATFARAVANSQHTLKRALTDQRVLAGIGNSYSDEILHRAQLSPFKHAGNLSAVEMSRLYAAVGDVLREWIERLRTVYADRFPERVTAFRPEMAVHGKYRSPCPVCGAPVQRIVFAENEANYCARCQTGSRLLQDRALSRLLKKNWPKDLDELEARQPRQVTPLVPGGDSKS